MPTPRNIVTIVGARPQFIKAATVSRAIARMNETGSSFMEEAIIHTGQHYDHGMSDIFFQTMDIPAPACNLDVKLPTHGAMTGEMLARIEAELLERKPDLVLVYGDTNSTLAGALAAAKLHIPVAHVEAGLRSFNRRMPEEINRVLTDHASALLFPPTQTGMDNLVAEGFTARSARTGSLFDAEPSVHLVGDVMYDGVLHYLPKAEGRRAAIQGLAEMPEGYALCTVHRAENTDDPAKLGAIFKGLEAIAADRPVVLPLHPRTKGRLDAADINPDTSPITFIDPAGYLEMLDLIRGASLVLTDSGGLQKEAFFLAKPCVTMRPETEWTETVDSGWNVLVGNDTDVIIDAALGIKPSSETPPPLYGDGTAADKIVNIIADALS